MRRVAAIGLDAAEWHLIEELLGDGALPNLARIRQKSAECRLRSEQKLPGDHVWQIFLSGTQDSDSGLGIIGFDPETYEAYQRGASSRPVFYSGCPIKAIAFDVPYLSLAGSDQDVRVCTWGSHYWSYPRSARPAGLLNEIDMRFGCHPAFGKEHDCAWYSPRFVRWLISSLATGSERRVSIATWLQNRFSDWNLFLTTMSETHPAGECFGHVVDGEHPLNASPIAALHREGLVKVYQSIDRAVGRFAAELPPDTVLVVFSLHGTTSNHGDLPSMVLLPELLYRFSFRKQLMRGPDYREWKSNGYPVVIPSGRWDHHMRDHFPDIVPKLKNWLVRMLPESVIEGVRLMEARLKQPHHAHRPIWVATRETDFEPGDIGEPRASLSWAVPCWYGRYWSRMKVFALPSFDDALIRINLRGRERKGIINLDDYKTVCDEVESCITACRNPRTGRPVVEEVIRTPGNPLDPTRPVGDIIVRWAGGVDAFKHAELGLIGPFPFKRTGGHTSHGFAFISGPGIQRADLGEHSAIDLPPTILALLGREPPFKLSGRPLLRASGC